MIRATLHLVVLLFLSTTLLAQPEAHYNFFRDGIDVSGNGNDLTIQGSLKTEYDSCRRYMDFDESSYLINDDPQLNINTEFTVAFWMRTPDVTADQKMIGQAVLEGTPRGFVIGPELGLLKAEIFTGNYGTTMELKSYPINANEWIHVALSFDDVNESYEMFLNGVLDTAYTGSFNDWLKPVSGDDLVVGIAPWDQASFAYEGDLDDLQIYNTALSATQISNIYNSIGLCPTTGNPIYVDSSATAGDNTGLTWTNAFTDLQEAIDLSCNCPGSDIWVAEGTYHPTQDNPASANNTARDVTFFIDHQVKIYGGFVGTETMRSEREWGSNITILDGAIDEFTEPSLHVVTMSAPETICEDWVLDGLHITNGRADENFGFNSSGAGLKISAPTQISPTISNCTFYNNKANVNGGAIDANLSDGSTDDVINMTVSNCTFYDNYAGLGNGGAGGAIYLNTPSSGNNAPTFINSLFYNNTAQGDGGAISATSSGISGSGILGLELINCTVADNEASGDGGGIYINADSDAFKIYNSIIWNNSGAEGDDLFTSGQAGIIDSTIIYAIGNEEFAASVQNIIINQDPLFVTPGSDYSLTQASPAINAGKDSYVPFDVYSDITGGIRILNGQVDIGAYEVAACGMDVLYVDIDADPGGDGLSWATAFTKLQDAIDVSASCSGVQSIWVAEGSYQPTKAYDSNEDGIISPFESREVTFYINHDVKIYGGFNGTETSSNQRNGALYPTILDGIFESTFGTVGPGNEPRAYHVMYIDGRDGYGTITSQTGIHDVTIQGGENDRSFGPGVGGAGMYINGSGVDGSAHLKILNCTFKNNSATQGGAIYNNGEEGSASFEMAYCTFENNEASSSDGGAIYNYGRKGMASPSIFFTTFENNIANTYGGAIANNASAGEASPAILYCRFDHNTAGFGGAISNNSSGSETNPGSSSPKIWNSIFYKNLATDQGGVIYNYADDNASSSPEIRNCTFSQNHAINEGEAVYNLSYVGGVVNPIVANTIMWDVDADDEIGLSVDASANVGHSIVKGGYAAGNNIITTYPNFVDTLNGNLKVMPMSSAINAGSNDSIPGGLTFDYVLAMRTIDGTVDIGAYENYCSAPADIIYVDAIINSGFQIIGSTPTLQQGGDGRTWDSAYGDLQSAINQSCDCGVNGEYSPVWIAGGTYYPSMDNPNSDADNFRDKSFVINKNIKIYGGFTSGDDELSDRDGSATTILSGDIGETDDAADNAYHVVYINGRDAPIDTSCRLDGLTIRDGRADNTNSGGASSISNADGAGMYLDGLGGSCSPTLENISFLENRTTLVGILGCQGGAIFCQGESGVSSPVISNSEFRDNKAGFGGAIYNNGNSGVSSPIIDTCTFEDNEAANGGYGGAIYNNGTGGVSSPEISNSNLEFNNATRGGAIYNDGSMGGVSSPVISYTTLNGNYGSSSGGAIYNNGGGGVSSPVITYSFLFFNQANLGGAIHNHADNGESSPTIVNTMINANNALSLGGAIYESATNNGINQSKIINCTFRTNTLESGGVGGIKYDERIEKSNFKDVDEYGGAIYATATTGGVSASKISNSIFWNNEDEIFIAEDAAPVVDHCIVQGGYTAGTNIIDQDPAITGHFQEGWTIAATSPAINAGINDSLPAAFILDLLGNDRINCDTIDIGAHEYQVELMITCSGPVTVDTDLNMCSTAQANVTLVPPTANCNIAPPTNNAPTSFPVGMTTFKWFVVDTDGRKDTCEQTVTVVDNQKPTITCPAPVMANTDIGSCTVSSVSLGTPTTSDNCTVQTVSNDAPGSFELGETMVTWTVTDAAGLQETCIQIVTVVDNEKPTITCPAPITISTDEGSCSALYASAASAIDLGTPVTSDNCTGETVINDAPGSFELGETMVKWIVTDAAGNKDSCIQIVTVEDNEDPMITCPSDTTITSGTNVILNAPITSDNCTGSLSVSNNAPTVFVDAVTTVTWTVTDAAMNQNTCAQIVTLDTTDPCEEDITIDQSPNGKASYSTNQNIFLDVQAAQSDTLLLSFGISTQALPAFEIAKGGVLEIVNTGCIED